jgi:subtilisin family serine protease
MTVATSRRSTTFRRSPAGGVAAAILLPAASPAAAAPDDGFWYFDALNVQAAHDAGWTGEGVSIAVIDSPINTEIPALANANIDVREPSFCYAPDGSGYLPAQSTELTGQSGAFHGTAVASLIAGTGDGYDGQSGVKGVAPDAKVLYYAVFGSSDKGGANVECRDDEDRDKADIAVAEAMNEAMDAGAKIISVTSSQTAGAELYAAQIRALRAGVVVVGSLSNTSDVTFSGGWPGTANGSVAVQSADPSGAIASTNGLPNSNPDTTVIAPGIGVLAQGSDTGWEDQELVNGTSFATPITVGLLALAAQKYPDATGNQLIQSLIRTTGAATHEPQYDPAGNTGYGAASVTGMLALDPSTLPDENPLVTEGPNQYPSIAEIAAGKAAPGLGLDLPSAPAPSEAPEPSKSAEPMPVGLTVGLVVGSLVIVVGVIILLVVLAVRRSRRKSPSKERLNS